MMPSDQLTHAFVLNEVSNENTLEALFESSKAFRQVLAGGMTLQTFVDKHSEDFARLSSIAQQRFKGMNDLTQITNEGVVCAWIAKLRFNEAMSDGDFFTHIKKADVILNGQQSTLNLKATDPIQNDNISLMWGLQALAAKQGYDNGAIRVRLPPKVAPIIFQAFNEGGAQQRVSTHAALTSVDRFGMGKDVVREAHRTHTPMGYGAMLMHRTFKNGQDAKQSSQNHTAPEDHDILFKMEDIGFGDKLTHTILHLLGPLKEPFLNIGDFRLFHKKTDLAFMAEKREGHYHKLSRKDHLSALGKDTAGYLLDIFRAIQNDATDDPRKEAFAQYQIKRSFRVQLPWPFESKIVGKDHQLSLGSFVNLLSSQEAYIQQLGVGKQLNALSDLRQLCQNDLGACREGFEVIVDASSTNQPSNVLPIGDFLKEPKLKKEQGFIGKWLLALKQAMTFFVSPFQHEKPVKKVVYEPVNVSIPELETRSHHPLPVVKKHTDRHLVTKDHQGELRKAVDSVTQLVEKESEDSTISFTSTAKLTLLLQEALGCPEKVGALEEVIHHLKDNHELSSKLSQQLESIATKLKEENAQVLRPEQESAAAHVRLDRQ